MVNINQMFLNLAIGIEKWKEDPFNRSEELEKGFTAVKNYYQNKETGAINNLYQLFSILEQPFSDWQNIKITKLVPKDIHFLNSDLTLSSFMNDYLSVVNEDQDHLH